MNYITNQLPQEFCDVLYRRRKRNVLNVDSNMVAEALKNIGNPLVVVSLGRNCSKFMCSDAIFVDMKVSRCKEDILGILFPKVESTGATTLDATNLYGEVLSTDDYDERKSSNFPSSISASQTDQHLSLNFVHNEIDQKSMTLNAPTIKADVQKTCCHLITATNGLIQKKPFDSEGKSQLDEALHWTRVS
ncbi:hypothetical protein ACOSP7_019148 [Xanthoceras sorbifolium]